jgi:NitT/TauT family transport system substrate-binding protein
VIRARRKAVEFMATNPDEAGDIVAKHYNLDKEVARSAVRSLVTSRTQGIAYWGTGQFHMDGMRRMVEVQKMVGAIKGDFDLAKMIDPSFLPDDIKALR